MSEPNEPILRPDSAGSSAGEPKKEDTLLLCLGFFLLGTLYLALITRLLLFTLGVPLLNLFIRKLRVTVLAQKLLCFGIELQRSAALGTFIV